MKQAIIALGADHAGFLIKEEIKKYLMENNFEIIDLGTDKNNCSVDYPVYAEKVSEAILKKQANLGVLCCGTGIGMSIVANKFPGIRAAVCESEFCAEMSRRHNDANVLCLGSRVIEESTAVKLVQIFVNTTFEKGRHENRINLIHKIESTLFK